MDLRKNKMIEICSLRSRNRLPSVVRYALRNKLREIGFSFVDARYAARNRVTAIERNKARKLRFLLNLTNFSFTKIL